MCVVIQRTAIESQWGSIDPRKKKSCNASRNLSRIEGNVASRRQRDGLLYCLLCGRSKSLHHCTRKQPNVKCCNHYHHHPQYRAPAVSSATRGCFEVTATFLFSYPIYLMLFLKKRVFCVCFSKRFYSGNIQRRKPSNSLWEIHNYNLKDPPLLFMFAPSQRLYKVIES